MTTLIARQPLQTLSMSASQRGSRRLSARLQEKDDAQPSTNGYHLSSKNPTISSANDGAPTRRAQDKPPAAKKRRIGEFARTLAGRPDEMGTWLTQSLQNMMRMMMASCLHAQKPANLGLPVRRLHQSRSNWPRRRTVDYQRLTMSSIQMRSLRRKSPQRSEGTKCPFRPRTSERKSR